MIILPRSLAPLLLTVEPEVYGLRYAGYGYGGIALEIVEPVKYQQMLWAIQESFTAGDNRHAKLWYYVSRLRVWRSRANPTNPTEAQ